MKIYQIYYCFVSYLVGLLHLKPYWNTIYRSNILITVISVVKDQLFLADECGQSCGEADSDEDVITDYHLIPALQAEMLPRPGGPLPTISVTPHSPANKTYPVLEDTLQQVRELHESVQQMRNVTSQSKCPQS